jgi:Uma2 family endonuclease
MDRGLEPDECFYLRNEPMVRGKEELNLSIDPPPDLAIEVELSRDVLDKMRVYAALGVPELWRFDGESLKIYELADDGDYRPRDGSLHLPDFPTHAVPEWIARAKDSDEATWARSFIDWIRTPGS